MIYVTALDIVGTHGPENCRLRQFTVTQNAESGGLEPQCVSTQSLSRRSPRPAGSLSITRGRRSTRSPRRLHRRPRSKRRPAPAGFIFQAEGSVLFRCERRPIVLDYRNVDETKTEKGLGRCQRRAEHSKPTAVTAACPLAGEPGTPARFTLQLSRCRGTLTTSPRPACLASRRNTTTRSDTCRDTQSLVPDS